MKIEITLDTTKIDRDKLIEVLSEADLEPDTVDTMSNEDLVMYYMHSTLDSNMDYDDVGVKPVKIIEIKE